MLARKPSIAGLMWLVLLSAIALALARNMPDKAVPRHLPLWLLAGWLAVYWTWFVVIPRQSLWLARHNPDRQRRLLEWVVNTPWSRGSKIFARYVLAANDQAAGRHARAESLYRLILKDNVANIDRGFESMVRQQMADSIEALGRPEEADSERERAATTLKGASATIDSSAQG